MIRDRVCAVIVATFGCFALPTFATADTRLWTEVGTAPFDLAIVPNTPNPVWYTQPSNHTLRHAAPDDCSSGRDAEYCSIAFGKGSQPRGAAVDEQGNLWFADSGLNAIIRVNPKNGKVARFDLTTDCSAQLNLNMLEITNGVIWFAGQNGYYGSLDPAKKAWRLWLSGTGPGLFGVAVASTGKVYVGSLQGGYIHQVDPQNGVETIVTPEGGASEANRIATDSQGRLWVSEWNTGTLSLIDPESNQWRTWTVPGDNPHPYAIQVDAMDRVWLSDWTTNSLYRFALSPGTPASNTVFRSDLYTDNGTLASNRSFETGVRQIKKSQDHIYVLDSRLDTLIDIPADTSPLDLEQTWVERTTRVAVIRKYAPRPVTCRQACPYLDGSAVPVCAETAVSGPGVGR